MTGCGAHYPVIEPSVLCTVTVSETQSDTGADTHQQDVEFSDPFTRLFVFLSLHLTVCLFVFQALLIQPLTTVPQYMTGSVVVVFVSVCVCVLGICVMCAWCHVVVSYSNKLDMLKNRLDLSLSHDVQYTVHCLGSLWSSIIDIIYP